MDQAQYWVGDRMEYQYLPVSKFVESFNSFHLDRLLEEKLCNPCDVTQCAAPIPNGCYLISNWNIFKSCFSREILLFKRNFPVHIFKAVQIAVQAFVVMTLFVKTKKNIFSVEGANKFMGALFAGVVIVKFNGMTELQMMINRLPIFYKQRELLHLPGWALLLSIVILSIPMSIIETGIWTCLTYFTIGYAPTAIRYNLLPFYLLFILEMHEEILTKAFFFGNSFPVAGFSTSSWRSSMCIKCQWPFFVLFLLWEEHKLWQTH